MYSVSYFSDARNVQLLRSTLFIENHYLVRRLCLTFGRCIICVFFIIRKSLSRLIKFCVRTSTVYPYKIGLVALNFFFSNFYYAYSGIIYYFMTPFSETVSTRVGWYYFLLTVQLWLQALYTFNITIPLCILTLLST